MSKLRLGLLFGGRSVEYEVSILSAESILRALDPDRYEVSKIEIDPSGCWHHSPYPGLAAGPRREVTLPATAGIGGLLPRSGETDGLVPLDVIFPIIHGRGGEDGSLQGLLELTEIAYVGSGVLSSAVQMDKDIAKQLLARADLPVLPWLSFRSQQLQREGLESAIGSIEKELRYPVFVKPANSGSSVGIEKASDPQQLASALEVALRYDDKLIVEAGLDAREIEIAVMGNESPHASVPGEIIPSHEFYDYQAKYHDRETDLLIPAPLSEEESTHLRDMAVLAYRALEAEGMARVDFLVDRENGKPYLNELNSLPGFTNFSMYPRLWEASGIPYSELLDRLIDLALERHRRRSQLMRSPAQLSDD